MLPRAPVQPQGAIIPAKAAVLYEMVVDSSRREALQFCRAHCLSWNSRREREYMCVCVFVYPMCLKSRQIYMPLLHSTGWGKESGQVHPI